MKIIAILLVILTLFGCAPAVPVDAQSESSSSASDISEESVPEPEVLEEPAPTEIEFVKPEAETPEELLEIYLETLYESYIAMLPVDISPIIDLDFEIMANVQNWNNALAMRRNIIYEKGYCYVEGEKLPYEIEYITKKDLNDQRMGYVNLKNYGKEAAVLHFVINGEDGRAYPPIFAVNSQHTVIMTKEEGEYKIAYHYFPGSEGKFENDLPVTVPEREEMEELLFLEFKGGTKPTPKYPKYDREYDEEEAVAYALAYCEKQNPAFHFVGDWYGNCMNFTSQCIWSGFREEDETAKNFGGMTKAWYCGKAGGTLVWSSVSKFWGWIQNPKCKLETSCFTKVSELQEGDIVNIGSYLCEIPQKYTHALLVVDEEKLMLAQNSPACFVYYSDLVNNYSRFIRPISLDS